MTSVISDRYLALGRLLAMALEAWCGWGLGRTVNALNEPQQLKKGSIQGGGGGLDCGRQAAKISTPSPRPNGTCRGHAYARVAYVSVTFCDSNPLQVSKRSFHFGSFKKNVSISFRATARCEVLELASRRTDPLICTHLPLVSDGLIIIIIIIKLLKRTFKDWHSICEPLNIWHWP